MNLPKSIRVGYRDFKIENWGAGQAQRDGRFGECDLLMGIIRVRTDVDQIKIANVLLHETIHAAWTNGDLPDKSTEEHAVTILANQLTQIWRDNPEFVAFMSKALAGDD